LGRMYDQLTPEERFRLFIEAQARGDETEAQRLAGTCQRYTYTFTCNDLAFADRVRASRRITVDTCLMLMQPLTKLMMARAFTEYSSLLLESLRAESPWGYQKGWEDGCDHAWQTAGKGETFPWKGDSDHMAREVEEALANESRSLDNSPDELDKTVQTLTVEVLTLWEAFSRFCRSEMGSDSEKVLLAWFPPMLYWIGEAKDAACTAQLDSNLIKGYEVVLAEAWRELAMT
jgi:hypothetical protein